MILCHCYLFSLEEACSKSTALFTKILVVVCTITFYFFATATRSFSGSPWSVGARDIISLEDELFKKQDLILRSVVDYFLSIEEDFISLQRPR